MNKTERTLRRHAVRTLRRHAARYCQIQGGTYNGEREEAFFDTKVSPAELRRRAFWSRVLITRAAKKLHLVERVAFSPEGFRPATVKIIKSR